MTDDLFAVAKRCLDCADPAQKVALTFQAWERLLAGELAPSTGASPPEPIGEPGRPPRPRLVHPRQLPQRGLGTEAGRVALVHAVAHIEFNAINLAWDAVYRFRGMPAQFYRDWASVAHDEARHFNLLSVRLAELGHAYGDFDAHNGLWDMTVKTAHSDTARMALVPRVLEARGLDVTPGMIERLTRAGDERTVAALEIILREEVAHVAYGTHWFRWCCERDGLASRATFRALLDEHMRGKLKGPFNTQARREAGFTDEELAELEAGL
ncbi:ferritin-like domain-containing protein [Oleiagrimonas sp. C23AA]|uniref:ferritin-like domain-containing protein n=1 Tax=Oleiagrimonas sp. C23AA TaxID=2719047 RepID=UPI001423CC18|nr:ferritin-like domain-containing protein [Oleiagrimonas sp. C23AA]NII09107.1 ferritin-like domain-containing protein [Oleiagrimonas sp. C23AA]